MSPENDNAVSRRRPLSAALFMYPLSHLALETYGNLLPIMWPLFAARFGLTYGAIGLLTMVYRSAGTLPQLGFATLSDRRGVRLMAVGGLIWMAVGVGLVGTVPNVACLVMLLALAPLGSAAFHPAGTTGTSQTLSRRRGTAVALFMLGGSLGSSLAPVIGARVLGRYGLSASVWFIPFGLVVALLTFLLVPSDSVPSTRRVKSIQPKTPIPGVIFLLMATMITQSWLESNVNSYLPLLFEERHLALTLASEALFAYSAVGAAGVFVGGALSDRMPRWRIVALAQVFTAPLYAGTLVLGTPWTLLAAGGFGFVAGMSHPVIVAMAQELMPDRVSLAAALTMGISWVLGGLGVTLTGVLADHMGMQPALLLNTGLPLVGIACMFAVYRMRRRHRLAGTGPSAG